MLKLVSEAHFIDCGGRTHLNVLKLIRIKDTRYASAMIGLASQLIAPHVADSAEDY
jgi:hypothetical protein